MTSRRESLVWIALLVSGAMLFLLSLKMGAFDLSLIDTLNSLMQGREQPATWIFTELRLPRALLAVFIGASLGMAGAALQGLLHNPLAEPGLVGVSSCAALGAVLVFYSGLAVSFPLALPIGGVAGAVVAVGFLYLLAGRAASTLTIILAGVAVSAFAGALTALVLNMSSNPFAFLEIIFWQMGSLADRSMDHVVLCLPLMIMGWILILTCAKDLDALTLGEEAAASLGVNLARVRFFVILGTALTVGSAVAVSGVIGFVGLVVPHVLRPWVGYRPARLLPISALGGAVLMLAADIAVRVVPTQNELKLGVLTALLGAPFFLYLVRRLRADTLS